MNRLWSTAWQIVSRGRPWLGQPRSREVRRPDTGEPEELALWRDLIEYRDRLTREIAAVEDLPTGQAVVRGIAVGRWGERVAERLARALSQSVDARSSDARARLLKLDNAIKSRPRRAMPPEDIWEDIRRDDLVRARDAVEAFLKERRGGQKAECANLALARLGLVRIPEFELTEGVLDDLANWARREHAADDNSDRARYIVARVAGIKPDSRILRD